MLLIKNLSSIEFFYEFPQWLNERLFLSRQILLSNLSNNFFSVLISNKFEIRKTRGYLQILICDSFTINMGIFFSCLSV